MLRFYNENYATQTVDVTFTPSAPQIQSDGIGGFSYEEFFGVGGSELVGGEFSIGGGVSVDVPFVGETDLFSARLYGALGAKFGLNLRAELDPGSIDATLPYQIAFAYPSLDPVANANETVDLFFANEFVPGFDSGFTTTFPSLLFELELAAIIDAMLGGEFAVPGFETTFEVFDFRSEIAIPLLSVDTDRQTAEGDADPINLFGIDTATLIDKIPNVEQAFNLGGEFAGVRIPLNSFFSSPEVKATDKPDATPEAEGDTETPEQQEPPDPSGLDLGSIDILVPNINTVSMLVDGVFVTDPTRELRDGSIVDAPDATDAFGNLLDPGNKDDLAALTLDLDGILTYATGGTFPPLEFGFNLGEGSLGPASFSVDFFYNLLDVELRAALPLVQEFTLTPSLAQKVAFFEKSPDGSAGAAKQVQVEATERRLQFDATGVFQSDAVEARLRELAATNLSFAQDLDLFVDFDAGIPGVFTGDVGGVSGRMLVSRDGGVTFDRLFSQGAPIAKSAPVLGQDQSAEIDTSGLIFAYEIVDDSGSTRTTEQIEIDFDPTETIYRFTEATTFAALHETPFLSDLSTLNVVYDGGETVVQVISEARPVVDARTGLEFDLSLLLEGLAANATFNAAVDIGPLTFGGSLDIGLGPLFSERFPLLNADIVDLYNDSYGLSQTSTSSFVLGGAAPPPDFGDAIVGTSGDDPDLTGTDGPDQIVGLDGTDILEGGLDDDLLLPGLGGGSSDGGGGEDTLDYSDIRGIVGAVPQIGVTFPGIDPVDTGALGGVSVRIQGLGDSVQQTVTMPDGATQTFEGIEILRLTDAADGFQVYQSLAGTTLDLGIPTQVFMLGGDDRAYLPPEPTRFGPSATLFLDMGDGDDAVQVVEIGEDWSTAMIEGGRGVDTLFVYEDFDLETGQGETGLTAHGFENLTLLGANGVLGGDAGDNILSGGCELRGRAGNDTLLGASNSSDLLIGGPGADLMDGGDGAGTDTVSYADAPTSIFVDMDFNGAARGFRGEAQDDILVSIERVVGSDFKDVLIGNADANILEGGDDDDRLIGEGGNDSLLGGAGNDFLARNLGDRVVTGNMLLDGGDDFDIAAFEAADRGVSGTTTGTIRFTKIESRTFASDLITNIDRTGTFSYSALIEPFLRARIGEAGADGIAQIIEPTVASQSIYTSVSVQGYFNYKADGFLGINTDWRHININIGENINFTRSSLLASANDFVDPTPGNQTLSQLIDANNGDDNVVATRYTSDIRSLNQPSGGGGILSTDVLRGIEGLIGTDNDDELFGSSAADALFGNGGNDYIEAGAGDDRLGFGEGQSIDRIGNPPLSPSVRSGGSLDPQGIGAIANLLSSLDPDDATTGASRAMLTGPVNTLSSGRFNIGSFLWGGAGTDTVDLRFDRGLTFRPEQGPPLGVFLDLDAGPSSAPVNSFTGERTVYGRATFNDFSTSSDAVVATLFGVENVIGTANDDEVYGDARDNVIEGGPGADMMDGRDGTDRLSYTNATAGVRLDIVQDFIVTPGGPLLGIPETVTHLGYRLDNDALTPAQAGDAAGDTAVNFELFETSDFADDVSFVRGGEASPTISIDLGAGDDTIVARDGGLNLLDLGAGDDDAELGASPVSVRAGAGNDVISFGDAPNLAGDPLQTSFSVFVDGGDDDDLVRFIGSNYERVTLTFVGFDVEQRLPDNGTAIYRLVDVEAIEVLGQRIRFGAVDPVVDAPRSLTIAEDSREPFALGIDVPQTELAAGDTYVILSVPDFAAIAPDGGAALAPADVITAETLGSLQVTAGQNYSGGVLRFARLDPATGLPETVPNVETGVPELAAPRVADLPAEPPIPGVSLGVTAPEAPDGQPVEVRITQLPSMGDVFYLAPHPGLAAFGVISMVPVAVAVGDVLTPAQAALLHYRPDANASGPAGVLGYTAETPDGFRNLSTTRLSESLRPNADGLAVSSIVIDVQPVDDAPQSRSLLYPISPGGVLKAQAPAGDPEGDPFTLSVIAAPERGTLDFAPSGTFTYSQDTAIDFAGAAFVEDIFTVRATQADGLAGPVATQLIRILNPATKAPIVFDAARTDVFFEDDGTPIRLGGLPANDVIIGHDGPDRLFGFAGLDIMDGGPGDDVLTPGPDADTLTLGPGADIVAGTLSDLDGDKIVDLSARDRVRLLDETGAPIQAGLFARNGFLEIDIDGDRMADARMTLLNGYTGALLNADFATSAPVLDFTALGVTGFRPGDQDLGDFTLSPDGLTLAQDSQSWEQVLGDFDIASDTRLRFDFSAETEGEIHAIMFTNGEAISRGNTIQVLGTQTFGVQAHNDYVAGSGVKSYDIALGDYITGDFDRIVFFTDDDANVGADSTWANVEIDYGPPPAAPVLDFTALGVTGFRPGDQDLGDFTLSPDGLTLAQDSQSWEQVLGDFDIASDTRLRFDFSAETEGEIHAIMFTNGEAISRGNTIQVLGTQTFGVQAHNDYVAGSGVKSYDIALGDYITGDFDRIVFFTDDDANVGADSTWANVEIDYGPPPAAPVLDFTALGVTGFRPGDQDLGDFTLSPDGLTLAQDSQSWEQVLGDFDIASDTRLRFDFSAETEGEIHAIMFTNGEAISRGNTIQVLGTQTFGVQAHNDYVAGSGVKSYDIALGDYITGDFDRIVFFTDDDANVGADSTWANVEIA